LAFVLVGHDCLFVELSHGHYLMKNCVSMIGNWF
jgi:hypothetical protein